MKSLAAAALLLLVVGAAAEAGPLPQAASLLNRPTATHFTHGTVGDKRKLPTPRPPGTMGAERPYQQSHGVRGK